LGSSNVLLTNDEFGRLNAEALKHKEYRMFVKLHRNEGLQSEVALFSNQKMVVLAFHEQNLRELNFKTGGQNYAKFANHARKICTKYSKGNESPEGLCDA
jgi:hypothetical protein